MRFMTFLSTPVEMPPVKDDEPVEIPSEPSPWQLVARRFDVGRMTRRDLRDLADALFAKGAISYADHKVLSIAPDSQRDTWPVWTAFETQGERDGRRDWMAEAEARIRKGHPDYTYIDFLRRFAELLKRVEMARGDFQIGTAESAIAGAPARQAAADLVPTYAAAS